MGPSRAILIVENGKFKFFALCSNLAWRGETGADLSANSYLI
jgi:hypothetical protein